MRWGIAIGTLVSRLQDILCRSLDKETPAEGEERGFNRQVSYAQESPNLTNNRLRYCPSGHGPSRYVSPTDRSRLRSKSRYAYWFSSLYPSSRCSDERAHNLGFCSLGIKPTNGSRCGGDGTSLVAFRMECHRGVLLQKRCWCSQFEVDKQCQESRPKRKKKVLHQTGRCWSPPLGRSTFPVRSGCAKLHALGLVVGANGQIFSSVVAEKTLNLGPILSAYSTERRSSVTYHVLMPLLQILAQDNPSRYRSRFSL